MELHGRTGTNSRGIIDKPVTPAGTRSRPRGLFETRDKELTQAPAFFSASLSSIFEIAGLDHLVWQSPTRQKILATPLYRRRVSDPAHGRPVPARGAAALRLSTVSGSSVKAK